MKHPSRLAGAAGRAAFLPLLALAAGCMGKAPQSTLILNSDLSHHVMSVYGFVTWITGIIGVLVLGLLVYAVVKFHDKGEAGIPEQVHGSTKLEIGWTIAPLVIVLVMTVQTIYTIFAVAAPPPGDALVIKVVGKQFWWEFEYPAEGLVTANEVHIPVGRAVSFEITSSDVLHSFWLPQFGGKRDAVPGRVNHIAFTPEKPGTFVGQCAEYCGESHALMELRVVAHEPADFAAWVLAQKQPAPAALTAASHPGAKAFLDGGCIACHTIKGNPVAAGRIGPDLTHFGSRTTLAAGILKNDEPSLEKWLADPKAVKPGTLMVLPRKLTEQEVSTLADYLGELK